MKKEEFNEGLLAFLNASPTPFHAVANMVEMLEKAGFKRLHEEYEWSLQANERYFITRNGSSLIAFSGAQGPLEVSGARMFGAHTDSPCLKIKPNPELLRKGYYQLGVEVYGGVLLNPWFDRELSLAGRVTYLSGAGEVKSTLINWVRPIAMIPSLAIHLDREVNNNRSINPQKDLPAVLMQCRADSPPEFRGLLLEQIKQEHPALDAERVLDYELCLYDTQPASIHGLQNEFLSSARLDNLLSCYIGLQALLDAGSSQPCFLVFNDHEEVGSVSAEGAQGPFLRSVLLRITEDEARLSQMISRSMMISADNAHGVHPNYADRHDENHGPLLNSGPVIKVNSNQRYATNSITSSFYRRLSEELKLPYQVFVVRTDMACGSTIGPLTAAELGVKTLDIGVPQFAMHSIRETCGSADPLTLYEVSKSFFNTATIPQA
ncbi:M18 family aminopeptidase [Hahella sp. NBU794]|uniref:M18 family aminopeptidase n=1 Tax=Hahella sp. NBU794 TaxID=3422590 RepID=UPI003D701DE1